VAWIFTRKDFYRDPNGLTDLVALQRNIRVQKDLGFLKSDVDIAPLNDLGMIKEAAQRLK